MAQVALVTGASRGIGRAIARRLAADGYAVAIHCHHNLSMAHQLCEEIVAAGGCAQVFACDVANDAEVAAMAAEISATFGDVSVVVNNAGIAQQKLFTDLSNEDWRQMMSVHVDGAFYVSRAFLPAMIRNHSGSIVNIASMWGETGGSCEVHYSTAKAALIGMTKALAKEVGPAGVRVNCVSPGVILTDMTAHLDESVLEELAQEAPLCRLGTPEDVAAAVAFLVSSDAAFVTGQVLSPNGGIVI